MKLQEGPQTGAILQAELGDLPRFVIAMATLIQDGVVIMEGDRYRLADGDA